MFDDWPLIESSFAEQYGIRLEHETEMSWSEYYNLMIGLSSETALGKHVSIRAEKDRDRLKAFNKDEHAIRNSWRSKVDKEVVARMSVDEKKKAVNEIQNIFKSMFSKEK